MSEPVLGRSCDGCYMCCKVFPVVPLQKPGGTWCSHCKIGFGCTIYDERPEPCREFLCAYRVDASLGEAWKPSVAKFVLYLDGEAKRIVVQADASAADSWRREPYYSQLKRWAAALANAGRTVIVFVGKRTWVIQPDRDIDLGELRDDEVVAMQWVMTPGGRRREAIKLRKDDPRVTGTA
jgi:hypothetical protein